MPSTMPSPARRIGTSVSFLPDTCRPVIALERGLDLDRLGRQVLGHLVRHQHGDLADELLEVPGAGPPVTEDGKLVLNEGMVEDGEIRKGGGGHASNIAIG